MENFFISYIYRLWDNRVKPIKAIKALIALSKNNEDTSQVFHVIDALKGSSDRKYFKIFSKSEIGKKILKERVNLLDTLKDKDTLSKLPKNSLGYKYYEFIYKENLSPEELINASESSKKEFGNRTDDEIFFNTRKRDMHDLWHVTTGYGRDALGELSLLAFTYAQEQNRGVGAIALYGYWKVGREFPNFNLRKVIREGYENGKNATLWSCEDWEKLIKMPIDEVREKINAKKPKLYFNALNDIGAEQIRFNNEEILVN
tara:strand:- start:1320 stop:2096 length:777 start_codon:yes stop_codon:yes gene_type:complete